MTKNSTGLYDSLVSALTMNALIEDNKLTKHMQLMCEHKLKRKYGKKKRNRCKKCGAEIKMVYVLESQEFKDWYKHGEPKVVKIKYGSGGEQ